MNSVCKKVYSIRCLFYLQCSTDNIKNEKGNICSEEFFMLLMDRNFNPFAISNKQVHIINGSIPVASRCVTFFTHTSEPRRAINTFANVLIQL